MPHAPLRLPLAALAAALVAASGCDFTPTLDIETPEHEAGAVVRAVLAADSVAVVRVGRSHDPYGRRVRYGGPEETPQATVTLLRDGQPVETLALRSEPCQGGFYYEGPELEERECGPYVGAVPVEAGGTYTVRVEIAGLPTAEGTVTVPARPQIEVEEEPTAETEPRRFRVRLTDAPGAGGRYGLALLQAETYPDRECDPPDYEVCRDVVRTQQYPISFDTSNPVLISAAREVPGDVGLRFVAFSDQTFDGQTFTFEIEEGEGYFCCIEGAGGGSDLPTRALIVQVAALSETVYDAHQISRFSLGDDNPFAEPADLPSNVTGGYGVVGAVAVAEASFAVSRPSVP